MPDWRSTLDRWQRGGLLDAATAARIRAFEEQSGDGEPPPAHWPARLLWSLGGILLGAGALLFVAAHWDDLSPTLRFALVLAMVAGFHLGAAAAHRLPALARVLDAVGTTTLGAGIALAGQVFNLQEHWPGGILLWAIGAALAWAILRDAAQAGLTAVLVPAWLVGEWAVAVSSSSVPDALLTRIPSHGMVLLALTYLSAPTAARGGGERRTLAWIGALAFLPWLAVVVFIGRGYSEWITSRPTTLGQPTTLGWTVAYGLPLALAVALRGTAAWPNLVAAAWVFLLGQLPGLRHDTIPLVDFAALGAGAVGLAWWGVRDAHPMRINLGTATFALTVLWFYFSNVMDRLDRALSLIGLGALFLGGGWLLERARRKLLAQVAA